MNTNKKTNAATLFVKCLEAEGVEQIFGVPGEENIELLEAIRLSSIKLIVTRDEQSAVFMASTVGRLTGRVGVALSTLGPGATNLVTGVAYAKLAGIPVLVITGQKPIKKSKQGKFQIIDVVGMMQPITKSSMTVWSSDRIPSMVRQSVKLAESERPGAVHLEFPEDIASEEVDLTPIMPVKVRRSGPDPKAVETAVGALEESKHPLVVVAAGANRKLIRKQLQAFLNKTKIPFVTTQMGKGVEDENSDLYIGTTALSGGDYVHKALEHADLLIMVGHDIAEKPPIVLAGGKKVVHINFSPAEIDDVYVPTHEIVGDISHSLWMMTENVQVKSWDFSYFFKVRDALRDHIALYAGEANFPMRPERVVADLRKALLHDGILSLDNGMYKIWIARNYLATSQNSVLLDNALATMGAGLPQGIVAKMLNPDKKVVVVAGDGGIMMNIAELETAKRLGVSLVVLILNDSGYGMIKWKQQQMGLLDFGLSFENPDFMKLAESFGAKGYRITSAEEFLPTLKQALDEDGINIIDCPVDYSQNVVRLDQELKDKLNKI